MKVFLRAAKAAQEAGDEEAALWFATTAVAGKGSVFFHIVDGENMGVGTALHQAATADKALQAAQHLLDANAKVNAVDRWNRRSPLHLAAFHGHADLITMLLEAEADPCARNKSGETPVDWAKSRHGAYGCLWFREVGLTRLVQLEGGRSRSDAQVVF